jgi:tRNA-Thr(GGU) m(6)t(6)A37 methyltransferase TsaA
MPPPVVPTLPLTPIGVIRTPFVERVSAPRQAFLATDTEGRLELDRGHNFEHALEDLGGWEYLWVLFWFHRNEGWKPKVLPPRSAAKRGVFATRSPYRPNPIGLSVVRLLGVEGLVVHVHGVDMLDGSPLLDIKPYVPSADAFPEGRTGWLEPLVKDPEPGFEIVWSDEARVQAKWLADQGVDLVTPVEKTLELGPQPHPYRRIRKDGDAMLLAVKDWRVRFRTVERRVTILGIATGYRPGQLAPTGEAPDVHRAFAGRFVDERISRQ